MPYFLLMKALDVSPCCFVTATRINENDTPCTSVSFCISLGLVQVLYAIPLHFRKCYWVKKRITYKIKQNKSVPHVNNYATYM